ncbi:NAD(P)/FAD-dependent oxidoreductase [Luteimonas dalianensis]|uniref:NAD(P)/FAD-dependent oxidoreductase n=1 Tax=Luteimonas dalianensis TaxID=1148196 RepID=UPI003D6AEAB5
MVKQNEGTVDGPQALAPDVLVIGGGPAGSTAATLLARRGWQVLMLEKDRHPRFHIGESLLPMNLPILERLGVLEQVRAIGVRKAGADFTVAGSDTETHVFRFTRGLGLPCDHAFQVRRSEFDQMLFEHARGSGVDARDGVRVKAIEFGADGRPSQVQAAAADGTAITVRPRYVVDASGRDTFLGAKLKLKRKSRKHQSAAIFSHFRGVERRPGEDAGNVTVDRFEHGWYWLIPLRDDVMSVGAVCSPEYLKQRRCDNETFLMQTLNARGSVARRMQGAQRVGPVHATGNYSYGCTRMCGPGWVMAGDAYAFIDPVFSSGVYLAMLGAEQATNVVDGALREPAHEAALQKAMEKRFRRGLRHFSWFIHRFTTPVMQRIFSAPRNNLQIQQAIVSMLAGDVFDNRAVIWRLYLFRALYALNAVAIAPQALAGWRERRRRVRSDFSGDTLQEGSS